MLVKVKCVLVLVGLLLGSLGTAEAVENVCDSGTLDTTCIVSSWHNFTSSTTLTGKGTLHVQSGGQILCLPTAFNCSLSISVATLVVDPADTTGRSSIEASYLSLSVSGDATIHGNVTSDGRGYAEGTGPSPGEQGQECSAGGSHAGLGGIALQTKDASGHFLTPRPGYGDAFNPLAGDGAGFGSGGGKSAGDERAPYHSGGGGGVVILTVGNQLDITGGRVSSNGDQGRAASGTNGGGGAGGTVILTAGTLVGDSSSRISADGGAQGQNSDMSYASGSGGGGYVKVSVTHPVPSTAPDWVTAFGGFASTEQSNTPLVPGGAGVVVMTSAGVTSVVVNCFSRLPLGADVPCQNTTLPSIPSSLKADALHVMNYATASFPKSATVTVASSIAVSDTSIIGFDTSATLTTASLTIDGTSSVVADVFPSTVSSRLLMTDTDTTTSSEPWLSSLNVFVSNGTKVLGSLEAGSINLHTGTLSFGVGSSVGRISAAGRGYPEATGPGAGAGSTSTNNYYGTGGSHAGYGGYSANTYDSAGHLLVGGKPYGTFDTPLDGLGAGFGSGGGMASGTTQAPYTSGAGGGVIVINATTSIDATYGVVTAAGAQGRYAATTGGGGSGGSVVIHCAGSLVGDHTTSINADGGKAGMEPSQSFEAGSGSGGRVMITAGHFPTDTSFIHALGGFSTEDQSNKGVTAAAGTVYLVSPSHTSLTLSCRSSAAGSSTQPCTNTTLGSVAAVDDLSIVNYATVLAKPGASIKLGGSLNITNAVLAGDASLSISATNMVVSPSGQIVVDAYPPSSSTSASAATTDDALGWQTSLSLSLTDTATVEGSIAASKIDLSAKNLVTAGAGTVSASGRGYPCAMGPGTASAPPSTASNKGGSGAGHAGWGGVGKESDASTPGGPYGSPFDPLAGPGNGFGSGGGPFIPPVGDPFTSGAGGGVVTVTLSGSLNMEKGGHVEADGAQGTYASGWNGGGGSGGSVVVQAHQILAGPTASVSSNGGSQGMNPDTSWAMGAGSGGYVLVTSDTALPTDFTTVVTAFGGYASLDQGNSPLTPGSAGIVTLKDPSGTQVVSACRQAMSDSVMQLCANTTLPSNTTGLFNVTVTDYASLLVSSVETAYLTVSYSSQVVGVGQVTVKAANTVHVDHSSTLVAGKTPAAYGASAVARRAPASVSVSVSEPDSGCASSTDGRLSLTAESLLVGGSVSGSVIDIAVSDLAFTSEAVGEISASGLGCGAGLGPGSPGATSSSGAGHGGRGGDDPEGDGGGSGYDDLTDPSLAGSGGGGALGGAGGGVIRITADTLSLAYGTIRADGAPGSSQTSSGGGSGGSIMIDAKALGPTTGGVISAKGGDSDNDGGGGGGGLVALNADTDAVLAGLVDTDGGSGSQSGLTGTSGRVFVPECAKGEFWNVTQCVKCGPNSFQPSAGAGVCESCPPGKAAPTAAGATDPSVCTSCSAGKYSEGLQDDCAMCPTGSATSEPGLSVCESCAVGSTTRGLPGATTCTDCPLGRFSSDPTTDCQVCNAGTSTLSTKTTTCTDCPAGSASAQGGRCVDCTAGLYAGSTGTPAPCSACPLGQFSNTTASVGCDSCPAGTYANVTGLSTCIPCPSGYFSTTPGATSSDTCAMCNPGYISEDAGSTGCRACPKNTYAQHHHQSVCVPCGSGKCSGGAAKFCETCALGGVVKQSTFLATTVTLSLLLGASCILFPCFIMRHSVRTLYRRALGRTDEDQPLLSSA